MLINWTESNQCNPNDSSDTRRGASGYCSRKQMSKSEVLRWGENRTTK